MGVAEDVHFAFGVGEGGADVAFGAIGDIAEGGGREIGVATDEEVADGIGRDGLEVPEFKPGLEGLGELLDGFVGGGDEEGGGGQVVEVIAELDEGGGGDRIEFVDAADVTVAEERAEGGGPGPVADKIDGDAGADPEVDVEGVARDGDAELAGEVGLADPGRAGEEEAALDGAEDGLLEARDLGLEDVGDKAGAANEGGVRS